MDMLASYEAAQKYKNLIELRKAVQRAEEAGMWVTDKTEAGFTSSHYVYTPEQALCLQRRQQELKELLATMRPRLVHG
jgi:hypothetical protein